MCGIWNPKVCVLGKFISKEQRNCSWKRNIINQRDACPMHLPPLQSKGWGKRPHYLCWGSFLPLPSMVMCYVQEAQSRGVIPISFSLSVCYFPSPGYPTVEPEIKVYVRVVYLGGWFQGVRLKDMKSEKEIKKENQCKDALVLSNWSLLLSPLLA